jgi:hypothetical protein
LDSSSIRKKGTSASQSATQKGRRLTLSDNKSRRGSAPVAEEEVHVTPNNKKSRDQTKDKRRRNSVETEVSPEQSSPKVARGSKKQKKDTKMSAFASKGIQTGPRKFQVVPVTNIKDVSVLHDGNVRRSQRAQIRPLEFWKNERYVYGPNEFDPKDGYIGVLSMPVPIGVSIAQPTPYKKRKHTAPKASSGGGAKKSKQTVAASPEKESFDSIKLRKKFEYFDGDQARAWDDNVDESMEMSKCN